METASAAQNMEETRSTTRVTMAKFVVKQRILVQRIVKPIRKFYANVSAPTASSLAAHAVVTVESTFVHANNITGRMRKRRNTVFIVKSADNPSVTATGHVSRSQQNVCVVQCTTIRSPPPSLTTPMMTST